MPFHVVLLLAPQITKHVQPYKEKNSELKPMVTLLKHIKIMRQIKYQS